MPELQTTRVSTDGHGVRIALAVKNWSQRDLARRIGMDETLLSRLLTGTLRGSQAQWRSIWRGLSSEDA
jgi:transcriptional regulator with XRE-family HTH domain